MNKSIKINSILNVIRTAMCVIYPLISFPYVSRVLSIESLGKVNYANSIVQYFILLAMLGTSTYATRECSYYREERDKLNDLASEIFTVNIVMTICAYIGLICLLFFSGSLKSYVILILFLSLSIAFNTMGIDWINSTFEDYFYITIRSIVIQIISLGLLFIVVRKPEDYYQYAFLQIFSNAAICVSNFIYCKKYVKIKIKIKNNHFVNHLKGMLVFFANSLAITVYCNADTTMIGAMLSDYDVGIYTVAMKIYTIIKNLIAAIFVVCIPKLSVLFGEKDKTKFGKLLNDILGALTVLVFPISFGLVGVSEMIVKLIAGDEYIMAVMPLQCLSIGIVFAIFGGFWVNCINIPMKKEKISFKATSFAAIINIVLNLFAIPILHQIGAALTTVVAEGVVLIISSMLNKEAREYIKNKLFIRRLIESLIGGITILTLCKMVCCFVSNSLVGLIISVVLGVIFYFLELLIFKEEFLMRLVFKGRWENDND